MPRKILNIVLSFILLVTTTGFTISEHFCGDNLVSVSVNKEPKPCCDMNGGCCHTESHHYQLKEDFIFSLNSFNFKNDHIIDLNLTSIILYNTNIPEDTSAKYNFIAESPPPQSLHKLLSQFQAYLL